MKASIIVLNLIMISCSCLMGMKTDLDSELQQFFQPLKIQTMDRSVQHALTDSVKRNMLHDGKDERRMIAWPQVRNDLQKFQGDAHRVSQKVAGVLGLLSLINTAWFSSTAMNGILESDETTDGHKILTGVALLLMIDNIIQLGNTFSSWKSLAEVHRKNNLYPHSMSDDERNVCAFMFFFNMIPAYLCSSAMGPDFAPLGTYMAALNMIAGLCTLANPGSMCSNRNAERNLNDIMETIDNHVSKKTGDVIQ